MCRACSARAVHTRAGRCSSSSSSVGTQSHGSRHRCSCPSSISSRVRPGLWSLPRKCLRPPEEDRDVTDDLFRGDDYGGGSCFKSGDGHVYTARPKATHLLDWFHLTMKLTVLDQCGKGLVHCEAVVGEAIRDQIERLTWSLWHGQVDKALGKIDDLATSMEPFS